ncbi:MAG: type II secretion system F family protein [Marinobacter sp.]|nr:type II secretion system F family protein [Marinobacter sp.]
MPELWLGLSILLAGMAVWMAVYLAPRWLVRARIRARLQNMGELDGLDDGRSWLREFAEWFTGQSAIEGDFDALRQALETTGRSRQQAQSIYMLCCWLLPALVIVAGFLILGPVGGALVAAGAFILPRRFIRTVGVNAEKRQNLEAIELCHMTRMLMEAGLSIERALRLIAAQGRPIMPALSTRLDRFNRVMESGADRTRALDELGNNRRILVLRHYVNLMKQSGTLGSGVSSSLDQIIQEAQQGERNRLKEETNRIGAKMTMVMMVFMLPALFILIGGPAVLSIAETLGR